MRPDTILTLGDFEFSRLEIPEKIGFGGDQALAIHELVGGVRVIDAMGRQDAPLEWSGLFMGENALQRALYLDNLRISGQQHNLTWHGFDFQVIIKNFHGEFERFYQIPYRISCIIVQDNANPVTSIADPGVDYLISEDMATAFDLGAQIDDGPLSALLSTLDSAISAVSGFATAAQSTINSVLQPLAAVQARVQVLTAAVGNVINNVSTIGGIIPNSPIAQQAANLTGQITAMTQLPQLYNLQAALGRMGGNLGTIGGGVNTISMAGGNLFAVASQEYGDPMAWTTLARANSLTDPQLSGINTLVVPAAPSSSGGVLNA